MISVLARPSDGDEAVEDVPSGSVEKGGTFSLLESPRHREMRARFAFGVSSGVGIAGEQAWSVVVMIVEGFPSAWWDRLPSTELWDLVCMLCGRWTSSRNPGPSVWP